jgi:hypothetical protein
MNKKLFTVIVLMLFVAGCASVTKDIRVETEADPKTSFSGYSSYSWLGSAAILYDPKGKWEPPQVDADAEIRFLIDRELRARGMTESSANPDLIVAYAAGIDMETLKIEVDPESSLQTLTNLPMGALVIALIDAKTRVAIWAGVATAEIQENPDQEVVKKRLDYAVSSMFKRLPK